MTLPKTFGGWIFLVAQVLLVYVTIQGTYFLVLAGRSATPFAAAGLIILFIFRFGEIADVTLEAFGIKAAVRRVNQAAQEAEDTVQSLKRLSMNLSSNLLALGALQGRRARTTVTRQLEMRDIVVSDLKSIKVSETEITRALSDFNNLMIVNLLYEAMNRLDLLVAADIETELLSLAERKWPLDIDDVEALFVKYSSLSVGMKGWLDEIRHFLRTGEVKLEKINAIPKDE